jgi:hypothetical protein
VFAYMTSKRQLLRVKIRVRQKVVCIRNDSMHAKKKWTKNLTEISRVRERERKNEEDGPTFNRTNRKIFRSWLTRLPALLNRIHLFIYV